MACEMACDGLGKRYGCADADHVSSFSWFSPNETMEEQKLEVCGHEQIQRRKIEILEDFENAHERHADEGSH